MAQELTAARVGVLNQFSRAELLLIQRTVAKDCNDTEFDVFITIASRLRLNPLKRQIYAFVFSKDDAAKRNMVIVTGIGGFRTIADRAGDYRPDDALPVYEYDESLKNPDSNPLGLKSCTVRVFKYKKDGWYAIPHQVMWDAFAPLIQGGKWEDTGQTFTDKKTGEERPKKHFVKSGKVTLDPGKPQWAKDPTGMLSKCAEAGALRKGWPDDLAGVYGQEEMDRPHSKDIELSPSEYAEQERVDNRLSAIHGKDTILMVFPPESLAPMDIGKIFDAAMAYFNEQNNDPDAIEYWQDQNKHGLHEFWARAATDCLALKKAMEKLIADGREAAKAAKAAADKELQNQTNEGGQNDSL